MIGILVVTHGDLGKALLNTASMLIQDNNMVEAVGFYPGQGAEDLKEKVSEVINQMKICESILCFVDMLGGTPSNVISEFVIKANNKKMKLITGINLPILIETITLRNSMEFSELISHILEVGKNSILDLGDILINSMKSQ